MRNARPVLESRTATRIMALGACVCIVGISVLACGPLGSQDGLESDMTLEPSDETPSIVLSPTATSTPIPAPQGVWSSYSTVNDVRDIEQDGDGYLWGIGTEIIVRWDLNSQTYVEFGEADGLPGNSADDIFIGPEGRVWLNFNGDGLWRFDDPQWTPFIEQGEVEGTRLDAYALSPTGDLWICTDEGLSKYDGEQWTAYQVSGGAIEGFCSFLTVDGQGNPWMQGTYGVSVLYEPDEWIVYDSVEAEFRVRFDAPIGAHTAPDGTLWFAYRENILWFDGTDWHGANIGPSSFALSSTGQPWLAKASARITEGYDIITYTYGAHWLIDISGEEDPQYVIGYYWPHPFHDNMPTTSTLCDIYAGLNGEMWISSVEGLLRIQGGSISLIRMEDIPSCLSFRDLEVTRGGVVYVVLPDGISRLSGNQLIPLHDDAGLGSNSVSLLAVDHAGTLWIKTLSELQYFDGNTWSSIDPPNRFVDDMLIMSNGDLWLAHGWPGGISRWDGSTWQEFEPGGIPGLLDGDAEEVAAFGDAQVCFAMKPEGVSCFDGSAWTSIEFSEGMVVDRLYDMVIDALGDIYVIASDRGNEEAFLYRFDGVSWSSWEINHRASSLAVAPDGSVWLADRNVGVFNIRDGQWIEENLAEGASIKPILDLQIGPDGSIWVGSDHGAWRFNGNEWESFLPEGMLLSENVSKIAIGPDGTIWFGGLGLARFGPAQ